VVFWAAVFDHLGDGPVTYAAEPAREPPPDWRRELPAAPLPVDAAPGIFQTADGPRALNVAAVRVPVLENQAIAPAPSRGSLPLRRPLLVVAVVLLMLAQLLPGTTRNGRNLDTP
jgi:hypothetical protein